MTSHDTTDGGVVDLSKEANHLFLAIQVTMTIIIDTNLAKVLPNQYAP